MCFAWHWLVTWHWFVDLDLSATINDNRYELDAGFIKHHNKHLKMSYWVNKPVTNTIQSNLKIATHMQLLCTVPVMSYHHCDTAAYWYHISTLSPTSVRKEGCLCLLACLPHRSWFQNQDCGAQREEDQTPDLVSGRQEVVSWCFSV